MMNALTDFQVITEHGKPAFVVIPYKTFVQTYGKPKTLIPHEVINKMVDNDISRVQAWREYLGFTQQEIASRLKISQAALSQMERLNARLRKTTLEKLAMAMGLTVDQLH